jgi:SNF2 family DNA or RNA helicase
MKDRIESRAKCCYPAPFDSESPDGYDTNAVIWRQMHVSDDVDVNIGRPIHTLCKTCPFCIFFPCLSMLHKVSSHVSLLQLRKHPNTLEPGSVERTQLEEKLAKLKVLLPNDVLAELPGKGYYQNTSPMNDHSSCSGKMKVLQRLLQSIQRQHGRTLLFSESTQALDLIENYIISEGYAYRRMDGTTPQKKRTSIADEFKRDSSILVFLLSTNAMGTGLNLTAANNVIIFDVAWNVSTFFRLCLCFARLQLLMPSPFKYSRQTTSKRKVRISCPCFRITDRSIVAY